jgi:predicted nucleic-acid-binding Zn-ribbon protein
MTPLSQTELDRIIKVLEEKGAVNPCPRCGQEEFTLVDAYHREALQDSLKGTVVGGPTIPCAVVICKNCGFISHHALGYLGILNNVDKFKKD